MIKIKLLFLFSIAFLFMSPTRSPLTAWTPEAVVSQAEVERYGLNRCFTAVPIPDHIFQRMRGHSYPSNCDVPRADLRYLKVLHYDFNGRIRLGEMVCNKSVANDLLFVFRQLYHKRYAIGSMRLIDDFGADDEHSMQANNTSCFCYRRVKGQAKLSKHALGLAVDVNPLYNPCVRTIRGRRSVQPANGLPYIDRKAAFSHKISRDDVVYKYFTQRGFRWGGAWRSLKDYQHFEK